MMRQSWMLLIFLSCFGAAGASELTAQDRTIVAQVDDRSKAPPGSPGDPERTVALLLVAPEITWLSDLAGKNIAIDEVVSASNDEARRWLTAMVNAELAGGRTKALDRLVKGEVSAAVLTLSYPETGEWSSEIAGFKVFRIPLVKRPQKSGSAPAEAAASDVQSASIQPSPPPPEARVAVVDHEAVASIDTKARERMRVATVITEHVMTLRDAEKKAAASPNTGELSVAIVVAGPEVKSVADLAGKIIAIDDRHSNLHTGIQAAFVVAGATDSLLTTSETKAAADRLLSGKASAAVLTLVYPETGFSAIEGYSVFRVSLDHRERM
jgi:ABC-type phosphate/phosphonate transport system substrate-binding protein